MQEFVARENTTQLPTIHVISDSVGVTGQAVARAAAAQFGVTNPSIEVLPKADDFEEIRTFLETHSALHRDRLGDGRVLVFYTLVNEHLRRQLADYAAMHDEVVAAVSYTHLYEGIDERAYALADRTLSLGDYVLTSGELASMVVIDAVVRKLPGVLGAAEGAADESFADGLLEYPQYTRPASFRGMDVPAVLLSGDHGAVGRWRRQAALEKTARLRPDLLEKAGLSPADREFLKSLSPVRDA